MSAVVLDTDVVSFAFKGDSRFRPYEAEVIGKSLVVSFMTVAELQLWGHVRNWEKPRVDKLLAFLRTNFAVYPSTGELCETWAALMADARRRGRALDTADAWIAATAVCLDVPLVTHNVRDFEFLTRLRTVSHSPK